MAERRIRYFTEIMDDRTRDLRIMLDILREVGAQAQYVLVGALAVGYHGRERATLDADMIVPGRFLGGIADEARARGYVVTTPKCMARVYPPGTAPQDDPDKSIADFMAAHADPVLQAAYLEVEPATVLGEHVQVVNRGALVALKFHAAFSETREVEDKHQDIADIGRVIKKRFDAEDEETAHRIAALSYPGAGNDFTTLIDDLRHGRMIRI